ncbi:MAG: TolC family protein [Gemmatimonadaceae bacterium]|nr:TolC family protein [Gemmatimonadaceae bacterium]
MTLHKPLRRPRLWPVGIRTAAAVTWMAYALTATPRAASAQLPSGAGMATTDSLTLRRALEIARAQGPGHQVALARRDAAKGRARETAQFTNPTIEYRRENLGSVLSPDIFATVYLPFDITGRRLALRRAGGAAADRADADGSAALRAAELDVVASWLRAATAQARLAAVQTQAAALRELARVDSARAREGAVSEGAAMRTLLEADRARAAAASLAGEVARARGALSRALGLERTALLPTGTIAVPALPASPTSDSAVAMAERSRPELAARAAAVREAQARLGAEQRGALGEWQLQGGSKKTAGVMTGQVGLAMPFPLFNRNDGARTRARAELTEAIAWDGDARRGVRAEVTAALDAYNALRATSRDALSFAQRGNDIAAIARISYREGHATLLELLDAERAAVDAAFAYVQWAHDMWMARLELERALGMRLDADSPLDLPLGASASTSSR